MIIGDLVAGYYNQPNIGSVNIARNIRLKTHSHKYKHSPCKLKQRFIGTSIGQGEQVYTFIFSVKPHKGFFKIFSEGFSDIGSNQMEFKTGACYSICFYPEFRVGKVLFSPMITEHYN